MKNNTAMIKIQATLGLTPSDIARAFERGDYSITAEMLAGYMMGFPTDEGYIKCPNRALIAFLDGLETGIREGNLEGESGTGT